MMTLGMTMMTMVMTMTSGDDDGDDDDDNEDDGDNDDDDGDNDDVCEDGDTMPMTLVMTMMISMASALLPVPTSTARAAQTAGRAAPPWLKGRAQWPQRWCPGIPQATRLQWRPPAGAQARLHKGSLSGAQFCVKCDLSRGKRDPVEKGMILRLQSDRLPRLDTMGSPKNGTRDL